MTGEMIKQQALAKTMPLVIEPPENWKTFNDNLNTCILSDKAQMRSDVTLFANEEPILECVLADSSLVVTTERVISILADKKDEMLLKNFAGFGNDYVKENNKLTDGKLPKTNLIAIKRTDNTKLYFKIDSYYPAHFATVLIQNLGVYHQSGNWFWNPKFDLRRFSS